MMKKIREMKKNEKMYITIKSFISETKNNYNKILRPLKIKFTILIGKYDFKIQN